MKEDLVFNISSTFKLGPILGSGAYGTVCMALHKPTGMKVAIKRIAPFDKPLSCLRTLREIQLLQKFRHHENIVTMHDIQKPYNYDQFNEVYLIQEYVDADLHQVIQKQLLNDEYFQYFVYQILRGLKMIHSANVIHRDLKPSNILVDHECTLRICDFGLARLAIPPEEQKKNNLISVLTEYVATRWYRAPEIMLSHSQYTFAIDVWSVGCILAEMFTGVPLFPGRNHCQQLTLIFQLLGTPQTTEDWLAIELKRARDYVRTSVPACKPVDLSVWFDSHPEKLKRYGDKPINPEGLDLLKRMLTFDPRKRITVDEALCHPYVLLYHQPEDEPTTTPFDISEFPYDCVKDEISLSEMKKSLYLEIVSFHARA